MKTHRGSYIVRITLFASLAWMATAMGVRAGDEPVAFNPQKPEQLEGVGVEKHLDTQLPLNVKFRNQDGEITTLGDIFQDDVPVILSLNYSNCPMLCSTQLTGLANSLRQLQWSAGSQFRVVSISIDPNERPARAHESYKRYTELYGRGGAGWSFLVGPKSSIDAVTEAVGFKYRYLPERDQYVHAALAVLCTPDGRIARYLSGVAFPEQTLRLSLVEASEGKIGGAGELFLLYCFHYDPKSGTYAPRMARLSMSVAGFVTLLVVIVGVLVLRSREPSHLAADETDLDPHSSDENERPGRDD